MKSQRSRILAQIDGKDLAFCHQNLRKALNEYKNKKNANGEGITKTDLRQHLADRLNLSPESIKNYEQGYNGPMDVDTVKKMAEYLELDWTALMKEVSPMAEKKMMEMEKSIENAMRLRQTVAEDKSYLMSEFERKAAWKAVRKVYKAMRNYVSLFEECVLVPAFMEEQGVDTVVSCYRYCEEVMHKNMLDIPEHTYNLLWEFLEELRYWIFGLPGSDFDEKGYLISDPVEHELHYFPQLNMFGVLDENDGVNPIEWADHLTRLMVDAFYEQIGSVLNDYRPREQY